MNWSLSIQLQLGTLKLDVQLKGTEQPLVLMGPNGAGKTTLLRTIAGAYRADSGLLKIENTYLFDTEKGIHLPPEKRHIGYLPQGLGLLPHLNSIENIAFGLPRQSKATRIATAQALLNEWNCLHLAQLFPAQLSGGEQQRIAIARAVVTKPQLWLMDEPLAALDINARQELSALLKRDLHRSSTPSIIVTHELKDIIALDATIAILEEGRITQTGSIASLRSAPSTPFVSSLFQNDASS